MNEYRDPCTGQIGCYADFHEPDCAEGQMKAHDRMRSLKRAKRLPIRQRIKMALKARKITKEG